MDGLPVPASGSSETVEASLMIEMGPRPADVAGRREDAPGTHRVFMCPDLYKAATSGNTALLLQLLHPATEDNGVHSPCSFSEVTAGRNTVLHLAASLGHAELAVVAFSRDRSMLMAENSRGDTPLHCAARAGHGRVVSLLLQRAQECGVEANEVLMKKNRLGDTALHEAVRNGHEEVAEVLMNKAPHLASIDNEDGVSPLYLAVVNGELPLVNCLMKYDEASFAGPKGQTALHASVLSNKEIASLLLEWKPRVAEEVDAHRSTPLHYAASGVDTEVVQMLLNTYSSAAYFRDREGFSPVHVAARVGNVDTIKLILETCPDSAELLDDKGRNFLHLAVEKSKIKVVEYVLKHGNKELEKLINEQDLEGNTPLHMAVESEKSSVVLALVRDGRTQKSIMNRQGETPLELASKTTRVFPLASIVPGLILWGAAFSVRRNDQVEPWNRVDGKWYDNISKNLAIISGLIATVAFSATFNVPGGYNSSGKATLHGERVFNVFMVFDSMAMGFSLVSTILLILVRAVDARERWLIFITGISTLWVAVFCMNVAYTVAAISVGTGEEMMFVVNFVVIAPAIYVLFFSPVSIGNLRGPGRKSGEQRRRTAAVYTQTRSRHQYEDVSSLLTGLEVLQMLSSLAYGLLANIVSRL